jgi:hypothetical protein
MKPPCRGAERMERRWSLRRTSRSAARFLASCGVGRGGGGWGVGGGWGMRLKGGSSCWGCRWLAAVVANNTPAEYEPHFRAKDPARPLQRLQAHLDLLLRLGVGLHAPEEPQRDAADAEAPVVLLPRLHGLGAAGHLAGHLHYVGRGAAATAAGGRRRRVAGGGRAAAAAGLGAAALGDAARGRAAGGAGGRGGV